MLQYTSTYVFLVRPEVLHPVLQHTVCILCSNTALHKSNILERYSLVQYGMKNMASVGKQVPHRTDVPWYPNRGSQWPWNS